jgi:hypothetical protein
VFDETYLCYDAFSDLELSSTRTTGVVPVMDRTRFLEPAHPLAKVSLTMVPHLPRTNWYSSGHRRNPGREVSPPTFSRTGSAGM